jgi:hypothetical protein
MPVEMSFRPMPSSVLEGAWICASVDQHNRLAASDLQIHIRLPKMCRTIARAGAWGNPTIRHVTSACHKYRCSVAVSSRCKMKNMRRFCNLPIAFFRTATDKDWTSRWRQLRRVLPIRASGCRSEKFKIILANADGSRSLEP